MSKIQEQIVSTDTLLERCSGEDDLAIMIVNIIICYNSISNTLEQNKVQKWVGTFSKRLQ